MRLWPGLGAQWPGCGRAERRYSAPSFRDTRLRLLAASLNTRWVAAVGGHRGQRKMAPESSRQVASSPARRRGADPARGEAARTTDQPDSAAATEPHPGGQFDELCRQVSE